MRPEFDRFHQKCRFRSGGRAGTHLQILYGSHGSGVYRRMLLLKKAMLCGTVPDKIAYGVGELAEAPGPPPPNHYFQE